ncbi:MAG: hypothetical protein AB7H80_14440 [Candidatus Kapaibacterium sp.]
MNERRSQDFRLSRPYRAEAYARGTPWGAALRLSPRPHNKTPFGSGSKADCFM